MAISYQWTPGEQREYALAGLFRYVKDCVYPFSPYYRKVFRENGIDPDRLASEDDLRRIPVTERRDVPDPRELLLRPGKREVDAAHDVEPLPLTKTLGYAWKTLGRRYLRDVYGARRSFAQRVEQTVLGEWSPVHFHAPEGSDGFPDLAFYTGHDLKNVIPGIAGMMYMFGWEPDMRALNMFPARPDLAFFHVLFAGLTVDNGFPVLHTCGPDATPAKRRVETAVLMPFDMYLSTPSHMTRWLETAIRMIEEGAVRKPDPVRFAVLAGEPLAEERRERLKERFERIGSPDVVLIEGFSRAELRGPSSSAANAVGST